MSEQNAAGKDHEKTVSTGEIVLYGTGTICNGLVGSTYNLLTPLMVLALGMNPVLAGLIMAVKTLWDAVTDPVMASITDNANTRWGRRRPFILVGGLLTIAVVLGIWAFIPVGASVKPNVKKTAAIEQPAVQNNVAAKAGEAASVVAADSAKETPQPAKPALPAKSPKKSAWKAIKEGTILLGNTSVEHKKTFFFLLITLMVLATTHTMFSVPYYALGIELSPTYHGRTRVVAYRSMFDSILSILSPWYLPFCMMAVFANPIVGMRSLATIIACFALPGVLMAAIYTRERTHVAKARKKVGVFSSIASVMKNRHFLKIAAIYIILQLSMGLFLQFSLYINIFHVFGGDQATAMKFGAMMQAKVGMLGGIMALTSIPVITWFCKRFQKHNALRIALGTTSAGCILNWFCYTPAHPNLQFILPFFFSLGIASTYTVLSTLMADVTDMDELNSGTRREGMFGAVMAWMSKGVGSIQALAAGALLVATGFNAQLSHQTVETILRMRILFSFAPATCLMLVMLLLYRYPLTRQRMEEVKGILDQRKKDAVAAAPAEA